jgi:hypothetical protein
MTWHTETIDLTAIDSRLSIVVDLSNNPHIVYASASTREIKYAHYDGVVWIIKTIYIGINAVRFASIILDASDVPHISFYDKNEGDLMYGYRDTSGWNIETVDDNGNTGTYTSIAINNLNRPCIIYSSEDHFDAGLKLATKISTGVWNLEVIDPCLGNTRGDIKINGPEIHVCYNAVGAGGVRYAYYNGVNWTTEIVETLVSPERASLVLMQDGNPCCCYHNQDERIIIARYNGVAWEKEIIFDDIFVHSYIATSLSGQIHISSHKGGGGGLEYINGYTGSWETKSIEPIYSGFYSCVAVDNKNQVHICHYVSNTNELLYSVKK